MYWELTMLRQFKLIADGQTDTQTHSLNTIVSQPLRAQLIIHVSIDRPKMIDLSDFGENRISTYVSHFVHLKKKLHPIYIIIIFDQLSSKALSDNSKLSWSATLRPVRVISKIEIISFLSNLHVNLRKMCM